MLNKNDCGHVDKIENDVFVDDYAIYNATS